MVRLISILVAMSVMFSVGISAAQADYPSEKLLKALIIKESKGNDKAIGDKNLADKAYGCLQIRQPCLDDVNEKFGTTYTAEQCLGNRELSVWICREYISMYATKKALHHEPTDQDKARIWNGGPKGHRHRSTLKYWEGTDKEYGVQEILAMNK